MSIEAGVVLGQDNEVLYWHLPHTRSGGSLPDSRDLWDVLWENRGVVTGFAHTHPGNGLPGPSYTDVTTFAAVEAGLGKRLDWWILSSDSFVLLRWKGPDRLAYTSGMEQFGGGKYLYTTLLSSTGIPVRSLSEMLPDQEWMTLLRGLSDYPLAAVDTVQVVEG